MADLVTIVADAGVAGDIEMRDAGFRALRVDTLGAHLVPDNEPDRSIVGSGTASVDDLVGGGARQAVEARSKARVFLRRRCCVAVEQGLRLCLVERFVERGRFGEAIVVGIAAHHRRLAINVGLTFEHGRAFVDLSHAALTRIYALVDATRGDGRQADAYSRALTGGKIAFRPEHIIENFIGLRQPFADNRGLAIGIEGSRNVGEGVQFGAKNSHLLTLSFRRTLRPQTYRPHRHPPEE